MGWGEGEWVGSGREITLERLKRTLWCSIILTQTENYRKNKNWGGGWRGCAAELAVSVRGWG